MDKEKMKKGVLIVLFAIHGFYNISPAKEPIARPLEEQLAIAGIQEEKKIKEVKENEQ